MTALCLETASSISSPMLRALIHREIFAIILDDIRTPAEDLESSNRIRELTQQYDYRWKSDLTVVGVSVGEAHESPEAEAKYFRSAPETAKLLREVVFPSGSPISRVVGQVVESWAPGVALAQKDGRSFLPEIARRWVRGGSAHPHIDQSRTPLLAPLGIEFRIGMNHYLSMPEEGGSIEFWNRQFSDEEYISLKRPDYGIDRSILGPADVKLRPRAGQTILFRAWDPHAVEKVAGERDRITSAAFLGYRAEDAPLALFA